MGLCRDKGKIHSSGLQPERVKALGVTTCIHKHPDLQSARFSTGINCVYPARGPELIANEPAFIRFDLQSIAPNQN